MLTILIIVILAYSFYTGYRRGLIMQTIQLVGYIATVVIATRYYDQLSEYVEMLIPFPAVSQTSEFVFYNEAQSFNLDDAFYRAISFVIITIIGWILTKFLSTFFTRVIYYDILKSVNYILGGIINLVITYVVVFVFLFIASLIPIEFVQQQFVDNPIAYQIVANTPVLSDMAADAWLNVNPFQ